MVAAVVLCDITSHRQRDQELAYSLLTNIDDAVVGLCEAFKDGRIPMDALSDTKYINVKTVQAAGLK